MSLYALANGPVHTGTRVLERGCVLVDGERIAGVLDHPGQAPDCPVVDLRGMVLAPGFVDLQINGCGGVLFNGDIRPETIEGMRAACLRFGTTSLLPTLMSCPDADIQAALEAVAAYRASSPQARWAVPGLHLEGPHLSAGKPGIHDPGQLRPPDPAMIERIASAGPQAVRLVTAAPEVLGPEATARLARAGVRVAAGHSQASFAQTVRCADAGLTLATHLFNCMPPLSGREPGLLGAVFLDRRIMAGIIADGAHTAWESLRLAREIMGPRLFLVTDAMPPAGTDMQTFTLRGVRIAVAGDRLTDPSGTLAGSTLTMDRAVRNCVRHGGVGLEEALRMASLYPARAVGLEGELGVIAPGAVANLVVLDQDTRVRAVVQAGTLTRFD